MTGSLVVVEALAVRWAPKESHVQQDLGFLASESQLLTPYLEAQNTRPVRGTIGGVIGYNAS